MAAKKPKNWEHIRKQKPTDSVKYRDVYEDQQLERGEILAKETMTGRNILNGVLCAFAFLLIWVIVSFVQMLSTGKGERELSLNPENIWIHVNEHYLNVNDNTDRITVEEFNQLCDEFAMNYDPNLPVMEEPEEPSNPETSGDYVFVNNRWEDLAGRPVNMDLKKLEYQNAMKVYEQRMLEYKQYLEVNTNPAYDEETGTGTYRYIREHYRNRTDTSIAIEVADYEKLVNEYKANLEKGVYTEDQLSIPEMPYDPAKWYIEESLLDESEIQIDGTEGTDGSDGSSGVVDVPQQPAVTHTCPAGRNFGCPHEFETGGLYHHHGNKTVICRWNEGWFDKDDNPVDAAVAEAALAQYSGVNTENTDVESPEVTPETVPGESGQDPYEYVYVDRNVQYRHKLDGHIVSQRDYEEMRNKYAQDISAYRKAYEEHRLTYHPDDIDGTKKIFTMAPNVWKVLISLCGSALLFGIMYMFLKKNLEAQNLLLDTADINQYTNDQHIALPEEVQRNYDWFPDVGAHSSVQVSSMISHMAITNKGLKQIEFAKRAEKDILDKDGDVEYYKGEILQDEDGNPITSKVPIIDEAFMDDLFDASGAPADKEVRKRYDTTKIPYNPDGSNRDKLGKFETVADMINSDWEFPLYEPQRPGGAYIVDTAPVNTMVLAITRAGKGKLARIV